jgi:acyl-CoA hydrolase
METHRLVLPADLNQFGHLCGGHLLSWVDEASWIAASLEFPACRLVTVGMDKVEFRTAVREGTILTIQSELSRQGKTSVTYAVTVRRGRAPQGDWLFSTHVTFVNVDEEGRKRVI